MNPKNHINPKFRAYGKARLDVAQRAQRRSDWDLLWKPSANPYPFEWGEHWRHCIEYKVDDFAAEVGFFIDIIGLPVNAFDPEYAQFTSPYGDFTFAVVPTPPGEASTPPDAIRIQFMIRDLANVVEQLEQRGVSMVVPPQPLSPEARLHIAVFCTPHGIPVELWGELENRTRLQLRSLGRSVAPERAPVPPPPTPKPVVERSSNFQPTLKNPPDQPVHPKPANEPAQEPPASERAYLDKQPIKVQVERQSGERFQPVERGRDSRPLRVLNNAQRVNGERTIPERTVAPRAAPERVINERKVEYLPIGDDFDDEFPESDGQAPREQM